MKYSILSLILATLFIVGCNNAKESSTQKKVNTSKKTTVSTIDKTDTDVVKLIINSNDQMQYDKKVLKVKTGSKVQLTLNHTGKMPKDMMGHNWVLLKKDTDIAAFATKSMAAKATDYIPDSDAVIAHTKTLGGGESTTITFDAPEKGEYDFICSFPAHYALMKGKFIVE